VLPPNDTQYFADRGIRHSVIRDANMTCVELHDVQLPAGFNVRTANLLLRLQPGYPDIPPDMWWFDPPVKRQDGIPIPATDLIECYLGRSWQRWSRHIPPGQWRSGVDGLESFLALMRHELERFVSAGVP
jgi:hypothetical protein